MSSNCLCFVFWLDEESWQITHPHLWTIFLKCGLSAATLKVLSGYNILREKNCCPRHIHVLFAIFFLQLSIAPQLLFKYFSAATQGFHLDLSRKNPINKQMCCSGLHWIYRPPGLAHAVKDQKCLKDNQSIKPHPSLRQI